MAGIMCQAWASYPCAEGYDEPFSGMDTVIIISRADCSHSEESICSEKQSQC